MTSAELPRFTEHGGHDKLRPLTVGTAPSPAVTSWLIGVTGDRPRSSVRVLDLGCGRGDTVAWLLEQGWDAHGLDVDQRYIANGRVLLGDRLSVLTDDGYPYEAGAFDVVISDQVFEHVEDLDGLAREVARVTAPGGAGLHVFPAQWIFREPHMLTPLVHWLPKGRLRRRAITVALARGYAAPYFTELDLDQRAAVFAEYSERETFYRSVRRVAATLRAAGLSVDTVTAARDQLQRKLGRRLPHPLDRLGARIYGSTRVTLVETRKLATT